MVRNPVVAGQFYPGSRDELTRELDKMIPVCPDKIGAVGVVVPHAGYVFSGQVAGEVYAKVEPRNTYLILSPNHTGYGSRFAASGEPWETPLGMVDIDKDFLAAVMRRTELVTEDALAHVAEHSIEVQLPFIQRTSPGAKIVPITVQRGDFSELNEVADALVFAAGERENEVLIVASSDMTHYESREDAGKKDEAAIRKVLELDAEGLMEVVEREDITMCGYIPVAIMLMCAKRMNAKKSELVKYSDSGDVTGDTAQVVGYAGIIVY